MTRILAIEDEPVVLETVAQILEIEGFEVARAHGGQAGLDLAPQFLPDLIICDVSMPQITGYDVLIKIRSDAQLAATPFIFLTAKNSRTDIRQGMNLGADDYLTKPFTPQELLDTIRSRLAKREVFAQTYNQQLESLRQSIVRALPHEFRTPLYGIVGYATLLMEDYLNISREEVLNMARRIYSSAERLDRLIENYLLYAQIELTFHDPERRAALIMENRIDQPAPLIRSVAEHFARTMQRTADLDAEAVDNAPIAISEKNLAKIIEELVGNAFKFSEPGTRVHVTAHVVDGNFRLTILDHGRGMTAEQIANVGAYVQFERKLYEQQGTGLGLAISRRLVELYGGQLTLETTLPRGLAAHVLLPLAAR